MPSFAWLDRFQTLRDGVQTEPLAYVQIPCLPGSPGAAEADQRLEGSRGGPAESGNGVPVSIVPTGRGWTGGKELLDLLPILGMLLDDKQLSGLCLGVPEPPAFVETTGIFRLKDGSARPGHMRLRRGAGRSDFTLAIVSEAPAEVPPPEQTPEPNRGFRGIAAPSPGSTGW
jgi:hypothetical protein